MDRMKRVKVREQEASERAKNFKEVSMGYDFESAKLEASRCLNCKNPRCVAKCPVSINIPEFIVHVKDGKIKRSSVSNSKSICFARCMWKSMSTRKSM